MMGVSNIKVISLVHAKISLKLRRVYLPGFTLTQSENI